MTDPSPHSHLYRLGTLLAVLFAVFVVVKAAATPSSWNYEDWYRGDALIELAQQPLTYGGNESCRSCHKATNSKLRRFKHRGLSCESCHGALADHARGDKKIADALVDKESDWQCMNCHSERVNKPQGFPQFSEGPSLFAKEVNKHKEIEEGKLCLSCHNAHDPTL